MPYRTSPLPSPGVPGGIPYIIGNEAAERFSFYGMKAILFVFMTEHLRGASGELAVMGDEEAKGYLHLFVAAVYFFPILGAVVSDAFLGKYRTIMALSIVYCLGHLALAMIDVRFPQTMALDGRFWLLIGLSLIALGSGGIKPCVSAHVGDQFGQQNQHLLSRVFTWFYFSINLGAFISTVLTPLLLHRVGPAVAFGVPGLLMFIATLLFWMGRHQFVHVPPTGMASVREAFSGDGLKAIRNLMGLYLFVAIFWCLFDQTASAWVQQAGSMDLELLGITWLPSQIQAANPILVLLLIPTCSLVIYPAIDRVFPLTPLRKVGIGLFLTAAAFSLSALIESWITAGGRPSIAWQLLAYVVLTTGEVMVSITCLEFSYTQAPKRLKSFIMSLYLLSVAAGNMFTSRVNFFIQNEDGTSKLPGASYYWFFTLIMLAAAVAFVFYAQRYRGRTYLQE